MKPQNHEVYRHNDDSEMEWVKPCNRETMKHIIISMTLSSEQNHENTKPWNLSSLRWLWDGVGETMQPQNHETMKPVNMVSWFCGIVV